MARAIKWGIQPSFTSPLRYVLDYPYFDSLISYLRVQQLSRAFCCALSVQDGVSCSSTSILSPPIARLQPASPAVSYESHKISTNQAQDFQIYVFCFLLLITMEASFPKPHSCQICQKFILKLDDRKAENLDEADTDIRKSIKFMQSVIEPRYRHLGLLNSSTVVFDYTLTEMMHAGAQGCMLCRWILEDPEEDARSALQMSECSTLAATLTSNYIYFGVLDSSEGESVEMMTREGMQSKFRRLSATFQLIAAAGESGKVVFSMKRE